MTIAQAGRWPLFGSEEAVARAVRATCRRFGSQLLLYCIADDHVHLVVAGKRAWVGRRVADLQLVLGKAFRPDGVRGRFTEPARIRPLEGRRHLEHLVGYIIRQPQHHGIGESPATWPGSCFQELVGARIVEGFDPAAVRHLLPRLEDRDVWHAADLPVLGPCGLESLASFSPHEIVRAAAAVFAVGGDLRSRVPAASRARSLALALLHCAGVGPVQASRTIGCCVRTARNHRSANPDASLVRSACLQLAIRAEVRRRGMLQETSSSPRRQSR